MSIFSNYNNNQVKCYKCILNKNNNINIICQLCNNDNNYVVNTEIKKDKVY